MVPLSQSHKCMKVHIFLTSYFDMDEKCIACMESGPSVLPLLIGSIRVVLVMWISFSILDGNLSGECFAPQTSLFNPV